ncbi:MAG TPA: hypothetical protein VLL73_03500, partial [Desulfurivibrionaceae bacterium]|nr:hypothetical protein [Desulfurivibrionaceae bacterium]
MAQRGRLWNRGMVVFVSLLLLVGGCKPQAQEPIRVGLSINLSGQGGEAAGHIRNGALLAVEEV